MRRLLYQSAIAGSWAHRARLTFDSLRLGPLCGDAPPPSQPSATIRGAALPAANATRLYMVRGLGRDASRGDFETVGDALAAARNDRVHADDFKPITIVLRGGVHYLNATLHLTGADSNTTISSYPGEEAWLSGGKLLTKLRWKLTNKDKNIWSADLRPLGIRQVPGLLTLAPHRRLTRARYPNADPEVDQWGYSSKDKDVFALSANLTREWWKPPVFPQPSYRFVNLSDPNNPTGHVKNDSSMVDYNTWGTGFGGVCETVWRTEDEGSYWCGNNSAGGWAEVDMACAEAGQLQLPVGVTYNMSSSRLARLRHWANASGARVHAWHSQSWFLNVFSVQSHDAEKGTFSFSGGGQQGGRNWCRCDQCTYAGPFCGQHQDPPVADTRLISGSWFVENVQEELDQATEWFFDPVSQHLHLSPNGTKGQPPAADHLVVPVLSELLRLEGTRHEPVRGVRIEGVGFRDARETLLEDWGVPSGGDWSLYRGGALMLENVEEVSVRACHFQRLDGNAVFLSRYTRDVVVEDNEFSWLGMNAVATWGQTKDWDATGGAQPRNTLIRNNYARELGIYEKQSSAVGQAKSCLSNITGNIFFNMPRAAINFNDGLGGGNSITQNLIWNTCRESGDHGPINTWDRMPFLHDVLGSGTPSYRAVPNVIARNFIVANYGGSQGVDNDDGSSFYDIQDNVFYSADGFKMDYGGHDSVFSGNLVMTYPYDGSNCYNLAAFKAPYGHSYVNNTCLIGLGPPMGSGCGDPSCGNASKVVNSPDVVGESSCSAETKLEGNQYYTPHGNASVSCDHKVLSLEQALAQFGVERGSHTGLLPDAHTILAWAQQKLHLAQLV